MQPMVRLVVLNYNGGDDVLECIDSLLALDWPRDRLEVVVVDNASVDGSADRIGTAHPSVRIVRNDRNTGFSANNLAMEDLAGVDFVGLVNPDAWVDERWLHALVDAFDDDPAVGAACPQMLLADRFVDVRPDLAGPADLVDITIDGESRLATCERTWRMVGGGPVRARHGGWAVDAGVLVVPVPRTGAIGEIGVVLAPGRRVGVTVGEPYDVVNNTGVVVLPDLYAADRGLGARAADHAPPSSVEAWTGGGVLLRADYLADVGLFDDVFFLYYEDVDLSLRGRRRGWRYRYTPDAVMWHHHAASSTEGSTLFRFHNERSRLLMIAKNTSRAVTLRAYAQFVLSTLGYLRADVLRPLLGRRRPDPGTVMVRLRALGSALRALPRVRRDRSEERPLP